MPSLTLTLTPRGPVVVAGLMVSTPRRNALAAAGKPIPPPVLLSLLVDTGASGTCIDQSHFPKLGIVPSGFTMVHTPTTAGTPVRRNQYDVDLGIILGNGSFHFIYTLPVIESSVACQGIDGLLGRDVLSQGILIYNGAGGSYTLSF
jgi:hypothetical protein